MRLRFSLEIPLSSFTSVCILFLVYVQLYLLYYLFLMCEGEKRDSKHWKYTWNLQKGVSLYPILGIWSMSHSLYAVSNHPLYVTYFTSPWFNLPVFLFVLISVYERGFYVSFLRQKIACYKSLLYFAHSLNNTSWKTFLTVYRDFPILFLSSFFPSFFPFVILGI